MQQQRGNTHTTRGYQASFTFLQLVVLRRKRTFDVQPEQIYDLVQFGSIFPVRHPQTQKLTVSRETDSRDSTANGLL